LALETNLKVNLNKEFASKLEKISEFDILDLEKNIN